MKQLTCEVCNGTDLIKENDVFICQSCGAKYSILEAKKMVNAETFDRPPIQIEKERLLNNAQTNIRLKRWHEAQDIYHHFANEYPDDYRGWWGLYSLPIQILMENPTIFLQSCIYGEQAHNYKKFVNAIFSSARYFRYASATVDITDLCEKLWKSLEKILPAKYVKTQNYSILQAVMVCISSKLDKYWLNFRDRICADYYAQAKEGVADLFPGLAGCGIRSTYSNEEQSLFPVSADNPVLHKLIDEARSNAKLLGKGTYLSALDIKLENNDPALQRLIGGFNVDMIFEKSIVLYVWKQDYDGEITWSDYIFSHLREPWRSENSGRFIDDLKHEEELRLRQAWRERGYCQYCGGDFRNGLLLGKKCRKCGKPKNY